MKRTQKPYGFTLLEIMIVVAIIGLLASLAVPSILLAGQNSRRARFAREIKNVSNAFVQYTCDQGDYPEDKTPARIPTGMTEYLQGFPWTEDTVIGGKWDWDYDVFGITAGVAVHAPSWGDKEMRKIDALIDDGNLISGQFRQRAGGYIYIIED